MVIFLLAPSNNKWRFFLNFRTIYQMVACLFVHHPIVKMLTFSFFKQRPVYSLFMTWLEFLAKKNKNSHRLEFIYFFLPYIPHPFSKKNMKQLRVLVKFRHLQPSRHYPERCPKHFVSYSLCSEPHPLVDLFFTWRAKQSLQWGEKKRKKRDKKQKWTTQFVFA